MNVEILRNILIVGLGSFLGGSARYLISVAMSNLSKGFPWGTLAVNLIGCFVIGLLSGIFARTANESNSFVLFCTVGICGGFTTFSTFSKEALLMLQAENYWALVAYVGISVVAGIVLAAVGYVLSRTM
jgi:CrcB protein